MGRFELQNPFAVANFIIDMAIEKDKPVTNLKLQKSCFSCKDIVCPNTKLL